MTIPEYKPIREDSASPTAEERQQPSTTSNDSGRSNPVKLCLHAGEDGVFCGRPALRERLYCYQHLRLRGQQMRMARARAQRQSCPLMLPPLDDLNAVKAALTQVTYALDFGHLEKRRAGLLLYALQQAATNLWRIELIQMNSARSHQPSQPASDAGEQKRLVEEYPGFEADFGLPTGLDLTKPPEMLFPPAEPAYPATATATVIAMPQATLHVEPPPRKVWSKEAIELEELDKQRPYLSQKSYEEKAAKVNDRMWKQAQAEIRKQKEAEWQAEADRRNALEEEKARIWRNMDEGQRRAYHLGVMTGHQEAREQAEAEGRERKPVASRDACIPATGALSNSAS
jgi:hypothetical protein